MRDIESDLTEFVFIENEPQKADVIFVPGNGYAEPSERAAELFRQGFAPIIIPSGRFSIVRGAFTGQLSGTRHYEGIFDTEYAFMACVLKENGVPATAVLREDRAGFTYQNAIFTRSVTKDAQLVIHRALLCCMPVHARRSFLYYKALFPEAEILVCPPKHVDVMRDSWMRTAKGIDAVLCEVERCGKQFHDILKERLLDGKTTFPTPLERRFMTEKR